MIKMHCTRAFHRLGRTVRAGEQFTATPDVADYLERRGRAVRLPDGQEASAPNALTDGQRRAFERLIGGSAQLTEDDLRATLDDLQVEYGADDDHEALNALLATHLQSVGPAEDTSDGPAETQAQDGPPEPAQEPSPEKTPVAAGPAEIKELGGGWFEVRGEKVQGREAAEALAKGS